MSRASKQPPAAKQEPLASLDVCIVASQKESKHLSAVLWHLQLCSEAITVEIVGIETIDILRDWLQHTRENVVALKQERREFLAMEAAA